jgi:hypothetical protein
MSDYDPVADAVQKAKDIVETVGLSEPLASIAFERALGAFLGPDIDPQKESGNGGGEEDGSFKELSATASQIAKGLSVQPQTLAEILHIDDEGQPQIDIPPGRLPKKTSDGARRVAVLTVAAQDFGLGEKWTSYETIRSACEANNVYDSKNFSKHMGKGVSDWLRSKGSGADREYQLRPNAIATAAEWVTEFSGG